MGSKTKIEWTGATWNPIRGCSVVSEGCRHCYAMTVAARFNQPGQAYEGLGYRNESGPHWTGEVKTIEAHMEDPLRWQEPRRIFVNSMSDLFHEKVSEEDIDRIFAVMALATRHTFQILTKRPERMQKYAKGLSTLEGSNRIRRAINEIPSQLGDRRGALELPLFNVQLGISAEDQKSYRERMVYLAVTSAAVRFVSFEPLLGHVGDLMLDGIFEGVFDWAIVGGESGEGARPMHPSWARSIRDQCTTAGVAFFFKQRGAWSWVDDDEEGSPEIPPDWAKHPERYVCLHPSGASVSGYGGEGEEFLARVGKKLAGQLLDGRTWREFPEGPDA